LDEDGDNDPILNGTVAISTDNGRFMTFNAHDDELRAYNETHSGPEAVCVDGYLDLGSAALVTNTSGLSDLACPGNLSGPGSLNGMVGTICTAVGNIMAKGKVVSPDGGVGVVMPD